MIPGLLSFEIRLDDLVLFHVREFRQARVGFTFARIGSVTERLRFTEIIAFLGPSGFGWSLAKCPEDVEKIEVHRTYR